MSHLSGEQLIELLYCNDSPVAAYHLGTCSDCARAYDELRADLADLKSMHPPARDEDYGHQVWASIVDRLPPYARPRMNGLLQPLWLCLGALVACALLIASFYAGRIWEHRQPLPHSVLAHAPAPPATPRVVVVVLSDHLERSERLLVQLKHASADDSELALPLRDEARSLLAANRACQQEAEAAADPALTQALDHLNDVLTELADHPGSLNANAIAKLQHEMDTEGLLFEVRVLRSRIPDHQASIHPHHAGGIA